MILITGGTGASGTEIVRQLAAAGVRFRMLVRDPVRAVMSAPKNAELFPGDLDNPRSIESAAKGCDTALSNSDAGPRLAEQQKNFLTAVKSAGVQRVVRFSMAKADPNSPTDFLRWHGQVETDLLASGLQWTLLRPAFFMQNILASAATIKSHRAIYMPAGDGKAPYVDLADIAAVAVKTLTTDGHAGKVYTITGPRDISWSDIASAIGQATAKSIQYVNTPPEAARQSLLDGGMEQWRAGAILGLLTALRNGQMTGATHTVAELTHKEPKSIEQWAIENASKFM